MITSMHIENFKCFKDFDIDLGPFNVLIGPNDSGKTSFLQAILLLSALGDQEMVLGGASLAQVWAEGFPIDQESVWRTEPNLRVVIAAVARTCPEEDGQGVSVRWERRGGQFDYWSQTEQLVEQRLPSFTREGERHPRPNKPNGWAEWFAAAIGEIPYVRFVPDALRKPSPLRGESLCMESDGQGLATFLQDIWGAERGREAFLAMEQEFYRRFPEYNQLIIEKRTLPPAREAGLALSFKTAHNEKLTADSVSDGAILALGYLALCYNPVPPRILLIEEPETGIHHARLKEVVQTLRGLATEKGVQVILTTHSPYLLDEVQPDEVHVFEKDEEGAVHAKKLSEFEGAEEIGGMFSTGEKWSMLSEKHNI